MNSFKGKTLQSVVSLVTQNVRFFLIFRILGGAFAAPTGGTGGVARCHLHGLGMRYDKKIKTTKNEKLYFSMKFVFFFNERTISNSFYRYGSVVKVDGSK